MLQLRLVELRSLAHRMRQRGFRMPRGIGSMRKAELIRAIRAVQDAGTPPPEPNSLNRKRAHNLRAEVSRVRAAGYAVPRGATQMKKAELVAFLRSVRRGDIPRIDRVAAAPVPALRRRVMQLRNAGVPAPRGVHALRKAELARLLRDMETRARAYRRTV